MSEIFSEKVVTSRRTYFFDVKETREGSKYLVIGELTQVGPDTERHRVMVFEESLETFVDGLEKAVDFIMYGEEDGGSDGGQYRDDRDEPRGRRDYSDDGRRDMGEIRHRLERIERSINEVRDHFR